MTLANLDDAKRLLMAAPPRGYPRIKIGAAATDDISTVDAISFLDAQESYIISRIGFAPVATDKLMIEVHANLTAFQIFIHMLTLSPGGDIPDFVKAWLQWAEEILDGVFEGKIKIERPGADVLPLYTRSSNFKRKVWEEIKLGATDEWTSLSKQKILFQTETIRSEKDGGTTYTRGTDYEISYKTGEIRRITGGSITEDQTVYADFYYIDQKNFYEREERIDSTVTERDGY